MHDAIKKILISEDEIKEAHNRLGFEITRDYKDSKLVLLGLLKGCIPFLPDLAKKIDLDLEIQYMVVSSYRGGTTSNDLQIKYDLETSIEGKDILIVEDIVDSGQTINTVIKMLKLRGAKSIEVVSLLNKPTNNNLNVKYLGFNIPNEFVIGYGLDFNELYRNLPYVGVLKEEYYK